MLIIALTSISPRFAGVLVAASDAVPIAGPPPEAWAVDDVWLSGHFEGLGLTIRDVTRDGAGIRAQIAPLASPGALQDHTPRDAANRAAAALIHRKFGIWPGA